MATTKRPRRRPWWLRRLPPAPHARALALLDRGRFRLIHLAIAHDLFPAEELLKGRVLTAAQAQAVREACRYLMVDLTRLRSHIDAIAACGGRRAA